MPEQLRVTPEQLHSTADALDIHAASFASSHQSAQATAADANLGSGLAAAALDGMLAATDAHAAEAATKFAHLSQSHRNAAHAYVATDDHGAKTVAGAGL